MKKLKRIPWIFIAVVIFLAGCSISAFKSDGKEAPRPEKEVVEVIGNR